MAMLHRILLVLALAAFVTKVSSVASTGISHDDTLEIPTSGVEAFELMDDGSGNFLYLYKGSADIYLQLIGTTYTEFIVVWADAILSDSDGDKTNSWHIAITRDGDGLIDTGVADQVVVSDGYQEYSTGSGTDSFVETGDADEGFGTFRYNARNNELILEFAGVDNAAVDDGDNAVLDAIADGSTIIVDGDTVAITTASTTVALSTLGTSGGDDLTSSIPETGQLRNGLTCALAYDSRSSSMSTM
mmetsp:Transcript_12959/g.11089  ORF Transcript_12959/g.11089 Transcript_12959/m.11089 type:complete len:245 (+) Transcript_12959:58-792(+)